MISHSLVGMPGATVVDCDGVGRHSCDAVVYYDGVGSSVVGATVGIITHSAVVCYEGVGSCVVGATVGIITHSSVVY